MTAQIQLPQYQCHKKVWALKIGKVVHHRDRTRGAVIHPVDTRYAAFDVPQDYVNKHQPRDGDYYIVYKDGYKSCSPAEAFEAGYTLID